MSGLKGWVGNRNGIPASVQSSTNGASHTTTPATNNRRQLLAAQARMPPPQTRLARQPLQPPTDRAEPRTYNPVAPSHTESEDGSKAMAEQFDSQDHYGGAFDTDAEGMDETSILSEVQVKDSQVDGRGTAPITSWATRQPEQEWNHAINQGDNDQQDAHMDIYEDVNAEGTEEGEASGLEEDEEMSDDEALVPDDDATVASMNLARELQEMKADSSWRPLVQRPKAQASITNLPRQKIPKPAVQHYPEPNKLARGRAQNDVRHTHNFNSDVTSGESDPDDENDEATRKKAQGSTNRQNGPHQARKRPDSQPKVVRVPQAKQPQMRPPSAQQPREEVRPHLIKEEQPLNHQHSPDTGPQSPITDETDHPKDTKPDLSDTTNNNAEDPMQNAAPRPPATLLPEHPPPNPTKRRLSLDYGTTTLRTMTYTNLRTQPFDHNPNPPPSPLPEPLLSAPLPSKLQHIATLPDADRSTFFATLTLAEWEDAGDWFVERFGELVKKMRAARAERRRVAGEFEEEVARREEYVRRSREGVEGEMRKMRRGGEDVLRNKSRRAGSL